MAAAHPLLAIPAIAALLAGCMTQGAPVPELAPVYEDAAEDLSGWTSQAQVLVKVGTMPPVATGRTYPGGHAWSLAPGHTGSAFHSGYWDSYRATLTSEAIPANGSLVLRFWLRGGVEQGADHLDVLVHNGTWVRLARIDAAYGEWTPVDLPFEAHGEVRLRFQLDTDASCSGAGGGSDCGPGHALGGYLVDGILLGR